MQGYNKDDFCTRTLYSLGIWEKSTSDGKFIYYFRHYFVRIITFIELINMLVLAPMGAYSNWKEDSLVVVENVFCISILIEFFVKDCVFFYWNEPIKKLAIDLEEMYTEYHQTHSVLSKAEQDIFDKTKWLAMFVPRGFLGSLYAIGAIYVSGSFVILLYTRDMFFRIWLPWDEMVSPNFELTLFLHGVSIYLFLVYTLAIDSFIMTILIHSLGHLKLLSNNLTNIRQMAENEVLDMTPNRRQATRKNVTNIDPSSNYERLKVNVQGKEKGSDYSGIKSKKMTRKFSTAKRNNAEGIAWEPTVDFNHKLSREKRVDVVMQRRMNECIAHHQTIIRFLRDVESALDDIFTSQLIGNLIPSGCLALWVTMSSTLGFKEVNMVIFIGALYTELFVFCLLANMITEESSRVREAVYGSDWFGAPEGFKRSMRIMMSMSNQPIVISTSSFVPLSMETFHDVAKLTYSNYMTLVTCMQDTE